jgi:hypothetical protein
MIIVEHAEDRCTLNRVEPPSGMPAPEPGLADRASVVTASA